MLRFTLHTWKLVDNGKTPGKSQGYSATVLVTFNIEEIFIVVVIAEDNCRNNR